MTLNVHQLRVFMAVVDHGSFGAAAEALHITQPAVSAQVRYLRQLAGVPLLVRDGRGVALTEAGRTLYRYAQEMVGATDALERDLHDIATGEQDHVIVAGNLAYGTYVLPSLLARFQQRHRNVRVTTLALLGVEVVERVHVGRADVGVLISARVPRELAPELLVAHLCDDELVVVESSARPFSHDGELSLEELAQTPFINVIRSETPPEESLNRLLGSAGQAPINAVMEFNTWEGTKNGAQAGAGVAVVFRSVVQQELARDELRVIRVPGFHQKGRVDLICSPERRRRGTSAVFEELLDFLRYEVPAAAARPPAGA